MQTPCSRHTHLPAKHNPCRRNDAEAVKFVEWCLDDYLLVLRAGSWAGAVHAQNDGPPRRIRWLALLSSMSPCVAGVQAVGVVARTALSVLAADRMNLDTHSVSRAAVLPKESKYKVATPRVKKPANAYARKHARKT